MFPDTDNGLGPCALTFNQYVENCLLYLANSVAFWKSPPETALSLTDYPKEKIEAWIKSPD